MPEFALAILIGIAAVIGAAIIGVPLVLIMNVVTDKAYDFIDSLRNARFQRQIEEFRQHDAENKARIHAADKAVGELTSTMFTAMQNHQLRFNHLPNEKARFEYILDITGVTAHPDYLRRAYKSAYNLHAQRTVKARNGKGKQFTPSPDKSLEVTVASV